MDWQEVLVIVLMLLTVVFLEKKFRKPKENCEENCKCSQ